MMWKTWAVHYFCTLKSVAFICLQEFFPFKFVINYIICIYSTIFVDLAGYYVSVVVMHSHCWHDERCVLDQNILLESFGARLQHVTQTLVA